MRRAGCARRQTPSRQRAQEPPESSLPLSLRRDAWSRLRALWRGSPLAARTAEAPPGVARNGHADASGRRASLPWLDLRRVTAGAPRCLSRIPRDLRGAWPDPGAARDTGGAVIRACLPSTPPHGPPVTVRRCTAPSPLRRRREPLRDGQLSPPPRRCPHPPITTLPGPE